MKKINEWIKLKKKENNKTEANNNRR